MFEEALPIEETMSSSAALAVDASVPFADAKRHAMDHFEREYLVDLLRRHGGVVTEAAAAAGLDRTHVYRLLRKHRPTTR